MDEFFQKLREIQKKERNLSGLAPVGERFYGDVSDYLNILMRKIDNNPFSFESYLLRDAQRITAEICERREHKISNSAVMNVQRSYQLFKESKSLLEVKVPRNSTPEEEKLYHALISSLVTYREKLMEPIRSYTPQNYKKSQDKPEKSENEDSVEEKLLEEGSLEEQSVENSLKKEGSEKSVQTNRPLNNDLNSSLNRSITVSGLYEDDLADISPVEMDIERDIYKKFGREPSSKEETSLKQVKKEVKVSKISNKPENNQKTEPGHEINKKDVEKDDSYSKQLKSSSNVQKTPTEILMILEELPSIMGVDERVYGPLLPQDVISMPQPNARILIKNHKGRSIQRYK